MRGRLAPEAIPISRSRSQAFDDLVVAAVERLQRALPELEDVEIVVEEVPGTSPRTSAPDPVPLGRLEPAAGIRPARIVVHRRPVELRAELGLEREDLVRDVVAELVAELFGISPGDVDPDYGLGE